MSEHSSPTSRPRRIAPGLYIVGSGIQSLAQLTEECRTAILSADVVFYLVADALTERWISTARGRTVNLKSLYILGQQRIETYTRIVDLVIESLSAESSVCLVLYGHPGVFAYPGHEAIRRAGDLGYAARMLPGIAADACLYADLGIDPGEYGCQSFEATDFLVRRRRFESSSVLILWQISCIGSQIHDSEVSRHGLSVLEAHLLETYSPEHPCFIYEASSLPVCGPQIQKIRLDELGKSDISGISTLVVTPSSQRDFDVEMLVRLKLA